MNTKTLLSIKTDKSLKYAAQKTAEELGFPLGTLINSFLKQFVRTKEISFSTTYKPSKYLIESIQAAEKEYRQNGKSKPMTGNDFVAHLKKL